LRDSAELAVAAGNWESLRSWQLAEYLRRNGKKGIRLYKEDFIVSCSYIETVINPLPGYY
jgi:hypothetical protein